MTLTQLRYVITIADTGSMNEASKALFISQPSLSQAVKELETEIGVELFKRSNRGVSVTQEGHSCCTTTNYYNIAHYHSLLLFFINSCIIHAFFQFINNILI